MGLFETATVARDMRLHLHPADRFKTVSFRAIFHLPLGPDAAAYALLPSLLRRGTVRHPDLVAIGRALDDLYGAALDGDVSRVGERLLVQFSTDLVAPRHLPGGKVVLGDGLRLLREVLLEPRLIEGRFPEEVFQLERENLKRTVEGLVNDRASYALHRAIEILCEGEPFAHYPYGTPETVAALRQEAVLDRYGGMLRRAPLDLYAVGPADRGELREESEALAERLGERDPVVPPPAVRPAPRDLRRVCETLAVDQGKLVLGLRTALGSSPGEDAGSALFVTLLGGGPFSKLFREIREKRSLAYYASATSDRVKGVLFVQAGIDPGNAEAVTALALEQVDALRRGEVSREEMEAARRVVRMRLRGILDAPAALVAYAVERGLLGRPIEPEAEREAIERAGVEAVAEAASRARAEVVYLLGPEARRA